MKYCPLVSVIIPTYNRSGMLRETLKSVLNQTYQNIEVLIISDASKDDTEETVKLFQDKRIHFYQFEEHQGLPAKTRNKGIKEASGEFIAFCDDDDLWEKKKIEYQLQTFEKYSDILLVCSRVSFFPKRLIFFKLRDIGFFLSSQIVQYQEMLESNLVSNSSVIIRSLVVEKIGMLDESYQLRAMEDYDYWLRILKYRDKSIYKDCRKLVKYRFHWNSISREYFRNGLTITSQRRIVYHKHYPMSEKSLMKLNEEEDYFEYRRLITYKLVSGEIHSKYIFFDKKLKIKHKITLFFMYVFDSLQNNTTDT